MTGIKCSAVTFNFANDSFTVIDSDGNTIRDVELAGDMDLRNGDIDAANGLGAQVQFTGRGLPDVDGEISVMRRNATEFSRCIEVSIGGRARIYKPDEAI